MPVQLAAMQDRRQSVVIASIWPFPLESEEPHYRTEIDEQTGQPRTHAITQYAIPAGADNMREAAQKVRLLRVFDSYQLRRVPDAPLGGERLDAMPLYCKDIAAGLVGKWTGEPLGAASGTSMGVMVLAGETPTDQEMQRMLASQNAYFQERFTNANQSWQQGKPSQIGVVERVAARWMNAHTRVEWYAMTDMKDMKECISCGGSLPVKAIACPNSGCGDLLGKALKGYFSEADLKHSDPYLYGRLVEVRTRQKDRERKEEARKGKSGKASKATEVEASGADDTAEEVAE